LKANTDYCVLGMTSRTAAHALVIQAPDFGNIRVGVPGGLKPEIAAGFFVGLSRQFDKPLIPVFNTGNKGQVNVGFCMNETAADTVITVHLGKL
jgi:hypothetical protein